MCQKQFMENGDRTFAVTYGNNRWINPIPGDLFHGRRAETFKLPLDHQEFNNTCVFKQLRWLYTF